MFKELSLDELSQLAELDPRTAAFMAGLQGEDWLTVEAAGVVIPEDGVLDSLPGADGAKDQTQQAH